MRLFIFLALVCAPLLLCAQEVIGVARCKSCHVAQHAQWAKTPHARAHRSLSKAQRRDPRCTSCHSTGDGPRLQGVQCESCHGAGRHYWPEPIMKDRNLALALGLKRGDDPAICARCHTQDSPRLKPFVHAEALQKVRHRK